MPYKKILFPATPLIISLLLAVSLFLFFIHPSRQSVHIQDPGEVCSKCNIVLISVDTLRYDRLGINGYKKPTSPNIDRFFGKSFIFKNAYAEAPWTLPSHAAMLTGVYPKKLNVELTTDLLAPEGISLARILKNSGYNTAAFSTGPFVTADQGFGQGFEFFKHYQDWQDAKTITKDSIDWLKENKKSKFFLFIHAFQVHDPYAPEKKFAKQVDPNYKGNLNSVDISKIAAINAGREKLSPADLERISLLYDGEIAQLDYYLSKVFEKINSLGLQKNTIVILTSDHGEEFGERGLWGAHGYSVYDELLHIPLLIKIPNATAQAAQVDSLTGLIDIPPTILGLLGIEPQTNFDGINLARLFVNKEANSERVINAETAIDKKIMVENVVAAYQNILTGNYIPVTRQPQVSIPKAKMARYKNYKLIQNFDGSLEFYDITNDPQEKQNLSQTNIEIKEKLEKLLNNY